MGGGEEVGLGLDWWSWVFEEGEREVVERPKGTKGRRVKGVEGRKERKTRTRTAIILNIILNE